MAVLLHLLLFITLSLITTSTNAHNITHILSGFPEYSQFNTYLSQTKLSDEVDSRSTVTVLALNNAAISVLATKKYSLSVIKTHLSLHILLDYFDATKLHQISAGTTRSTSLYQTTGKAENQVGFVNITNLKGGKIGFGSAAAPPGSTLNSTYVQEIATLPYDLSVIEISELISAPGVLTESSSDLNITDLLEKAGCKESVALFGQTGLLKVYEKAAADKGLTVFVPSDGAFKAPHVPDLSKLTNAELVSLLQYHALSSYSPKGTLKVTKGPIDTMATNGIGKYVLTVTTAGDEVTVGTGYSSSRIETTVIDSPPVVIFTINSLLLPVELFGKESPAAPVTSPAPAPVTSPAPAPSPVIPGKALPPLSAKAPSPVVPGKAPPPLSAKAPSPFSSPPAPPTESPVRSPAAGPGPSENSNSDTVIAPGLLKALLTVSIAVIVSVILS